MRRIEWSRFDFDRVSHFKQPSDVFDDCASAVAFRVRFANEPTTKNPANRTAARSCVRSRRRRKWNSFRARRSSGGALHASLNAAPRSTGLRAVTRRLTAFSSDPLERRGSCAFGPIDSTSGLRLRPTQDTTGDVGRTISIDGACPGFHQRRGRRGPRYATVEWCQSARAQGR